MRRVLLEAIWVASVGALLAFAANAISPRGLKLTRDFFGQQPGTSTNQVAGTNAIVAHGTNSALTLEQLKARLQAKGLQLVDSNWVVSLFHDPRFEQGLVAFIDARDDSHYQQGHIPAAYPFDYYRPENYLPTVLPVCQIAQEIVVYCNGGACEDSEFAAGFLLDAGIPKEKLLVYGGGMIEWATNGLPVEVGIRQSGQILKNGKPVGSQP